MPPTATDGCGEFAGPHAAPGLSGAKIPETGKEVVFFFGRGIRSAKDLFGNHEFDNRGLLDLLGHLGLQELQNRVSWAAPHLVNVVLTLPYEWSRKSSRP